MYRNYYMINDVFRENSFLLKVIDSQFHQTSKHCANEFRMIVYQLFLNCY